MPNTEDNFAKIEDYLFDRMPTEDRQAFEQELLENEALARELSLHRAEHRAMQILLHQDLQASIENWKAGQRSPAAETDPRMPAMKVSYRKIFLRLAAASVFLAFGIWWFMRDTPDKLFQRTEIAMRSAPGDLPADLARARMSMNEKQYDAALTHLDRVESDDYAWDIAMMRGECYYWLSEYDKAAAQFEPLVNEPITLKDGQLAEFYLLLTYWAKGDKTKGKMLLEKIMNTPDHEFGGQAGKIKNRF